MKKDVLIEPPLKKQTYLIHMPKDFPPFKQQIKVDHNQGIRKTQVNLDLNIQNQIYQTTLPLDQNYSTRQANDDLSSYGNILLKKINGEYQLEFITASSRAKKKINFETPAENVQGSRLQKLLQKQKKQLKWNKLEQVQNKAKKKNEDEESQNSQQLSDQEELKEAFNEQLQDGNYENFIETKEEQKKQQQSASKNNESYSSSLHSVSDLD